MLRLSKLTDYGIVVMTYLAQAPGRVHAANEISAVTHVASPTVSKVLKALSRGRLVQSMRGAKGGYRLARRPAEISVGEVVDAMEGPVALTECSMATGSCEQESYCNVRGNWQRINAAVREALDRISLEEMVQPAAAQEVRIEGLHPAVRAAGDISAA